MPLPKRLVDVYLTGPNQIPSSRQGGNGRLTSLRNAIVEHFEDGTAMQGQRIAIKQRPGFRSLSTMGHSAYELPADPVPFPGMILWLRGDAGITTSSGIVQTWDDQSGYDQHMTVTGGTPTFASSSINSEPGVTFNMTSYLERATALLDSEGNSFDGSRSRTIFVVARPNLGSTYGAFGTRIGGPLLSFKTATPVGCYAMYCCRMQNYGPLTNSLFNHDWWPEWSGPIWSGIGSTRDNQPSYANVPILVEDQYDGLGGLLSRFINTDAILQTTDGAVYANQVAVGTGDTALPGPFTVGNVGNATGAGTYVVGWQGDICEVIIYDYDMSANPAALAQTREYLMGKYGLT